MKKFMGRSWMRILRRLIPTQTIRKEKSPREIFKVELGIPFEYKDGYYLLLETYRGYVRGCIPKEVEDEIYQKLNNIYTTFSVSTSNGIKGASSYIYLNRGIPKDQIQKITFRGKQIIPDWFTHINAENFYKGTGNLYSLYTLKLYNNENKKDERR